MRLPYYPYKLVKAYHTDEKIMIHAAGGKMTVLMLFLQPGPQQIINKYWHEKDGKIKSISDGGVSENRLKNR